MGPEKKVSHLNSQMKSMAQLGQKLSLRNVPQLTFTLDHSIEHGARINQILSDLDIPEDFQDEY